MSKLTDLSINEYIDQISSKTHTPGGGAVMAIVALEGLSLIQMQLKFSIDKKGYDEYQEEFKKIKQTFESVIEEVKKLADYDMIAFNNLMENYRKEEKDEDILQECYKSCAKVPYMLMEKIAIIINSSEYVIKNGNLNLLSDGILGYYLLATAFNSSNINMEINLKYVKDEQYIDDLRQKTMEFKEVVNSVGVTVNQMGSKL